MSVTANDTGIFANQAHVPPDASQLVMIDDFIVDCALVEEHTYDSEVTDYPVEKGADITDNVRPKPLEVRIEAIVSNTPTSPDILAQRDIDTTPADQAYLHLMDIRDNREPVTIRTSLDSFDNMVLKSLNIPRSASTGDALRFTATFVQVEIVSNTRSTRVAIPIAKKPKDVNKAPIPANDVGLFTNMQRTKIMKIRTFDGFADWYWLDDAIGGWRTTAQYTTVNDSSFSNSAFGNFAAGVLGTGGDPIWAVTKGRPFGAAQSEWIAHQDDAYWASRIANAVTPDTGVGADDFDPFNSAGTSTSDIKIVSAQLR